MSGRDHVSPEQFRLFDIQEHAPGMNTYHRPEVEGEGTHLEMHDRSRARRVSAMFQENFQYQQGSSEAVHLNAADKMLGMDYKQGFFPGSSYLGRDDIGGHVNPDLGVRDLEWTDNNDIIEGITITEARTPEGSPVGTVAWERDRQGDVYVSTAEIAKPYQGRGLARPAIGSFLEHAEGGPGGKGGIYTDEFTEAGQGAFGKKGIPAIDTGEGGLLSEQQRTQQAKKYGRPLGAGRGKRTQQGRIFEDSALRPDWRDRFKE